MQVSKTKPNLRALQRQALLIVLAVMLYNCIEAVVALSFGHQTESLALFGFGLDSLIEIAAAGAMVWRLTRSQDDFVAERRVNRFIGLTFFLLSLFIVVQSITNLSSQQAPESHWMGIAIALASLIIMPLAAWQKIRLARQLESRALLAEAKETLACSLLSLILLIGLGAYRYFGWWWVDSAAALVMVPWLVKEGWEVYRGGCGCNE